MRGAWLPLADRSFTRPHDGLFNLGWWELEGKPVRMVPRPTLPVLPSAAARSTPAEGRTGGRPPALSSEKVEAVRSFLKNGGSVSAAARTFGVSRPTVRAVRDGTYVG